MTSHQKNEIKDIFLQNSPDKYVYNRHYKNFEDFSDSVKDWRIEFTQLSAGDFRGQTFQVKCNDIYFEYASLNQHLKQTGESPPGMRTFVIPATPNESFRWRHHEISGNTIAIFPENRELEALSKHDFNIFSISLSQEKLMQLIESHGVPQVRILVDNNEVVKLGQQDCVLLRRYLVWLHRQLIKQPQIIDHENVEEEFESELPRMMLNVLDNAIPCSRNHRSKRRNTALKKALEYIAEFDKKSIKMDEVGKYTGVSTRTLEYAFHEHFGISPQKYIKSMKLNKIRKNLQQCDSVTTSIIDIANEFGFWHMGQFARDYRRLFGELPSETLNGKTSL